MRRQHGHSRTLGVIDGDLTDGGAIDNVAIDCSVIVNGGLVDGEVIAEIFIDEGLVGKTVVTVVVVAVVDCKDLVSCVFTRVLGFAIEGFDEGYEDGMRTW
ncbi:hypothetical protein NDU88_001067 [Pleurodeles waltl]|uniref:Uncharacterized protein n=1 Tax=Pleurodeles waltl TaxID=8319 RepID=A0AAV7KXE8_PLEWA|nr:hypothetical protein NDU88_001067 [Pleurodeles waltl]